MVEKAGIGSGTPLSPSPVHATELPKTETSTDSNVAPLSEYFWQVAKVGALYLGKAMQTGAATARPEKVKPEEAIAHFDRANEEFKRAYKEGGTEAQARAQLDTMQAAVPALMEAAKDPEIATYLKAFQDIGPEEAAKSYDEMGTIDLDSLKQGIGKVPTDPKKAEVAFMVLTRLKAFEASKHDYFNKYYKGSEGDSDVEAAGFLEREASEALGRQAFYKEMKAEEMLKEMGRKLRQNSSSLDSRRLVVAIDENVRDFSSLAKDLDFWKVTADKIEDPKAKVDELIAISQCWSRNYGHIFDLSGTQIQEKLQGIKDDIVVMVSENPTVLATADGKAIPAGAGRVKDFLDTVFPAGFTIVDRSMLPKLSLEGMTVFAQLQVEAEDAVMSAVKKTAAGDLAGAREDYLLALGDYAELKDEAATQAIGSKIRELLGPQASGLEVTTTLGRMYSELKGSGVPLEGQLKEEIGSPELLKTFLDPVVQLTQDAGAKPYAGKAADLLKASKDLVQILKVREQAGIPNDDQGMWTLLDQMKYTMGKVAESEGTSKQDKLELREQIVSLDVALMPEVAHSLHVAGSLSDGRVLDGLAHPEWTGTASLKIDADYRGREMLQHLQDWQLAIFNSDLQPKEELDKWAEMSGVLSLYRPLTKAGEPPVIAADKLDALTLPISQSVEALAPKLIVQQFLELEGKTDLLAELGKDLGKLSSDAMAKGDPQFAAVLRDPKALSAFVGMTLKAKEFEGKAKAIESDLEKLKDTAPGYAEKKAEALQLHMKAAELYAQRGGPVERVREALKPAMDFYEGVTGDPDLNPADRAEGYLDIAKLYQGLGLKDDAGALYDKVLALDRDQKATGKEDARLTVAATMAQGERALLKDPPDYDGAKAFFHSLPGVTEAEQRYDAIVAFQRSQRLPKVMAALQAVADEYASKVEQRDGKEEADKFRSEFAGRAAIFQEKLQTGNYRTVEELFADFGYVRYDPLQGYDDLKWFVGKNDSMDWQEFNRKSLALLQAATNPEAADKTFAELGLDMGEYVGSAGDLDFWDLQASDVDYFAASGQILDMMSQDQYVGAQAKSYRDDIPNRVIKNVIGKEFGNLSVVGAENLNESAKSLALWLVPLGVGKLAGTGARLLGAGERVALWSNMIATPLSQMLVESAWTGNWDAFSAKGLATTGVTTFASFFGYKYISRLSQGLEEIAMRSETAGMRIAGQAAVKPVFKVLLKMGEFSAGGLYEAGSAFAEEAVGLKEVDPRQQGASFWWRAFERFSVGGATNLQMHLGEHVVGGILDVASGGKIPALEQKFALQDRLPELQAAAKSLGWDLDFKAAQAWIEQGRRPSADKPGELQLAALMAMDPKQTKALSEDPALLAEARDVVKKLYPELDPNSWDAQMQTFGVMDYFGHDHGKSVAKQFEEFQKAGESLGLNTPELLGKFYELSQQGLTLKQARDYAKELASDPKLKAKLDVLVDAYCLKPGANIDASLRESLRGDVALSLFEESAKAGKSPQKVLTAHAEEATPQAKAEERGAEIESGALQKSFAGLPVDEWIEGIAKWLGYETKATKQEKGRKAVDAWLEGAPGGVKPDVAVSEGTKATVAKWGKAEASPTDSFLDQSGIQQPGLREKLTKRLVELNLKPEQMKAWNAKAPELAKTLTEISETVLGPAAFDTAAGQTLAAELLNRTVQAGGKGQNPEAGMSYLKDVGRWGKIYQPLLERATKEILGLPVKAEESPARALRAALYLKAVLGAEHSADLGEGLKAWTNPALWARVGEVLRETEANGVSSPGGRRRVVKAFLEGLGTAESPEALLRSLVPDGTEPVKIVNGAVALEQVEGVPGTQFGQIKIKEGKARIFPKTGRTVEVLDATTGMWVSAESAQGIASGTWIRQPGSPYGQKLFVMGADGQAFLQDFAAVAGRVREAGENLRDIQSEVPEWFQGSKDSIRDYLQRIEVTPTLDSSFEAQQILATLKTLEPAIKMAPEEMQGDLRSALFAKVLTGQLSPQRAQEIAEEVLAEQAKAPVSASKASVTEQDMFDVFGLETTPEDAFGTVSDRTPVVETKLGDTETSLEAFYAKLEAQATGKPEPGADESGAELDNVMSLPKPRSKKVTAEIPEMRAVAFLDKSGEHGEFAPTEGDSLSSPAKGQGPSPARSQGAAVEPEAPLPKSLAEVRDLVGEAETLFFKVLRGRRELLELLGKESGGLPLHLEVRAEGEEKQRLEFFEKNFPNLASAYRLVTAIEAKWKAWEGETNPIKRAAIRPSLEAGLQAIHGFVAEFRELGNYKGSVVKLYADLAGMEVRGRSKFGLPDDLKIVSVKNPVDADTADFDFHVLEDGLRAREEQPAKFPPPEMKVTLADGESVERAKKLLAEKAEKLSLSVEDSTAEGMTLRTPGGSRLHIQIETESVAKPEAAKETPAAKTEQVLKDLTAGNPKLAKALKTLLAAQETKTSDISFLSPNQDHIGRVLKNSDLLLANPEFSKALEGMFGPNYRQVVEMAALLSKIGFGHEGLNPGDNKTYLKNRIFSVDILDHQLKPMLMESLGLSETQYKLFREAILREGTFGIGTGDSPRAVKDVLTLAKKFGIDLEGVYESDGKPRGKYENPLTALLTLATEADVSKQRLQAWQTNDTLMKALVRISADPDVQELYSKKAILELRRDSLAADEVTEFDKEMKGLSVDLNKRLRAVVKREILSKKKEFIGQLAAELELKGLGKKEAKAKASEYYEQIRRTMTAVNGDSYLWFLGSYGVNDIKITPQGEVVVDSQEDLFPQLGAAANLPHVKSFHADRLGEIIADVNQALGTDFSLKTLATREDPEIYDLVTKEPKADTHTHLKMAVDFDAYIWSGTILSHATTPENEKIIAGCDQLLTKLFLGKLPEIPEGDSILEVLPTKDEKTSGYSLQQAFKLARETAESLHQFVAEQKARRGEAGYPDYEKIPDKDDIVEAAKREIASLETRLETAVKADLENPDNAELRKSIETAKKRVEIYEQTKFFVRHAFNFQEGDLTEFVPHFMAAAGVLKLSPLGELPTLKRITQDVLEQYQKDNVKYFEPRFNIGSSKEGALAEIQTVIQAYEEWKRDQLAKNPDAVIPEMQIILSTTKFADPNKPYSERVAHKVKSAQILVDILREARKLETENRPYADFVLNPKPSDPYGRAYAVTPKDVLKYMAGLDAAGQEEYNPPSLFFEAYKVVRAYNDEVRAEGRPELAIGNTFHVSESNTDVSPESALRYTLDAVYMKPLSEVGPDDEPIMNRLGHAIVPGIGNFDSLLGTKPKERVAERLRQIDHDLKLLDLGLPLQSVSAEGLQRERAKLLKDYPTPESQEGPVIELPEYTKVRVQDLELRAAYTRDRLIELGITVETNPTSNVGISPYITGYKTHTLDTYLKYQYGDWARQVLKDLDAKVESGQKLSLQEKKASQEAQAYLEDPKAKALAGKTVKVTINSDDLTIFGTNLSEEFYRAGVALKVGAEKLRSLIADGFDSPIRKPVVFDEETTVPSLPPVKETELPQFRAAARVGKKETIAEAEVEYPAKLVPVFLDPQAAQIPLGPQSFLKKEDNNWKFVNPGKEGWYLGAEQRGVITGEPTIQDGDVLVPLDGPPVIVQDPVLREKPAFRVGSNVEALGDPQGTLGKISLPMDMNLHGIKVNGRAADPQDPEKISYQVSSMARPGEKLMVRRGDQLVEIWPLNGGGGDYDSRKPLHLELKSGDVLEIHTVQVGKKNPVQTFPFDAYGALLKEPKVVVKQPTLAGRVTEAEDLSVPLSGEGMAVQELAPEKIGFLSSLAFGFGKAALHFEPYLTFVPMLVEAIQSHGPLGGGMHLAIGGLWEKFKGLVGIGKVEAAPALQAPSLVVAGRVTLKFSSETVRGEETKTEAITIGGELDRNAGGKIEGEVTIPGLPRGIRVENNDDAGKFIVSPAGGKPIECVVRRKQDSYQEKKVSLSGAMDFDAGDQIMLPHPEGPVTISVGKGEKGNELESTRPFKELPTDVSLPQGTPLPAPEARAAARVSSGSLPAVGTKNCFGEADPTLGKVKTELKEHKEIKDSSGKTIGEANLIAGGETGTASLSYGDGSYVSSQTSEGGRDHQEDSTYLGRFTLPDGQEVKIIAGSDGAGGAGGGDVASSAFLQGVHAQAAKAIAEGKVPTADDLFRAGRDAVIEQRKHAGPRAKKATGTGSIVVIVGDTAMIASAGDAMVAYSRRYPNGEYQTLGYTHIDNVRSNVISNSISANMPNLYVVKGLQPGDRFTIASDGGWENVVGVQYKEKGSTQMRGAGPTPDQDTFQALNGILAATFGTEGAAEIFHDLARGNIQNPGQTITIGDQKIQMPLHADRDNIFAISYEQGEVKTGSPVQVGEKYRSLEPVPLTVAPPTRKLAAVSDGISAEEGLYGPYSYSSDMNLPAVPTFIEKVPPPLTKDDESVALDVEGNFYAFRVHHSGDAFDGLGRYVAAKDLLPSDQPGQVMIKFQIQDAMGRKKGEEITLRLPQPLATSLGFLDAFGKLNPMQRDVLIYQKSWNYFDRASVLAEVDHGPEAVAPILGDKLFTPELFEYVRQSFGLPEGYSSADVKTAFRKAAEEIAPELRKQVDSFLDLFLPPGGKDPSQLIERLRQEILGTPGFPVIFGDPLLTIAKVIQQECGLDLLLSQDHDALWIRPLRIMAYALLPDETRLYFIKQWNENTLTFAKQPGEITSSITLGEFKKLGGSLLDQSYFMVSRDGQVSNLPRGLESRLQRIVSFETKAGDLNYSLTVKDEGKDQVLQFRLVDLGSSAVRENASANPEVKIRIPKCQDPKFLPRVLAFLKYESMFKMELPKDKTLSLDDLMGLRLVENPSDPQVKAIRNTLFPNRLVDSKGRELVFPKASSVFDPSLMMGRQFFDVPLALGIDNNKIVIKKSHQMSPGDPLIFYTKSQEDGPTQYSLGEALESASGLPVFINGTRLGPGKSQVLQSGDVISFGTEAKMTWYPEGVAPPKPEPMPQKPLYSTPGAKPRVDAKPSTAKPAVPAAKVAAEIDWSTVDAKGRDFYFRNEGGNFVPTSPETPGDIMVSAKKVVKQGKDIYEVTTKGVPKGVSFFLKFDGKNVALSSFFKTQLTPKPMETSSPGTGAKAATPQLSATKTEISAEDLPDHAETDLRLVASEKWGEAGQALPVGEDGTGGVWVEALMDLPGNVAKLRRQGKKLSIRILKSEEVRGKHWMGAETTVRPAGQKTGFKPGDDGTAFGWVDLEAGDTVTIGKMGVVTFVVELDAKGFPHLKPNGIDQRVRVPNTP